MDKYGGFGNIEKYLDFIWFTMTHKDDPDRQALIFDVRCYLDGSGTHDQSSYTVVAGLLLNRHNFISLGKLWYDMLNDMETYHPIHMKEFGRPDGQLGYLTDIERYNLFKNISYIINSHKIISIAATINQQQYRDILKLHKRKEMSPYGLCFMLCAVLNHYNAEYNEYNKDIAFLLDEGEDNVGHILAMYKRIKIHQKTEYMHMGSIAFDDDKKVPALQAADVISWGVLRKLRGKPFDTGYDFIEKIIEENHLQGSWDDANLKGLAKRLMKYRDQNH